MADRILCMDCSKPLGHEAKWRGNKRCRACYAARPLNRPACLDCGKPLSNSAKSRGDKRCVVCAGARRRGTHRPWTWRDGIRTQRYSQDWIEIREAIRKRDDYLCQHPGCYLPENGRKHDCHHIDRNRASNHQVNLILLCKHHHGITKPKYGNEEHWQLFYEEVQAMRGII